LTSGGYDPNKGAYQADLNQAEDFVPTPSCLFQTRNLRINATGEERKNWFLLTRPAD
jgi:hypothetical protein